MTTKRRIVYTIKEGNTNESLYRRSGKDIHPKGVYISKSDPLSEEHEAPLQRSKSGTEKEHYNSRFYNTLGEKSKQLYRTFVIDFNNEQKFNEYTSYLSQNKNIIEDYYEDGKIIFNNHPNDPEFSKQSALYTQLGIEQAWDSIPQKGENIIVSVIDTGVEPDHPDLFSNLWKNNNIVGFPDTSGIMGDLFPENGHGTSVTGIITAVGNNIGVIGIAPNCQVQMHMLFVDGTEAFMTDCITAIKRSEENKAKIINCSFELSLFTEKALKNFVKVINEASKKMLFVFSSGNSGKNINGTFLASLPMVLKVGALTSEDTIAEFSNFGEDVVYAYGNAFTTIRNNSFGEFIGTSASAPQVAGIAALLMSHNTNVSPFKLKSLIEENCDKLNGFPISAGKGKVNVNKALSKLLLEIGSNNLM